MPLCTRCLDRYDRERLATEDEYCADCYDALVEQQAERRAEGVTSQQQYDAAVRERIALRRNDS